MFKFDFDIEDVDEDFEEQAPPKRSEPTTSELTLAAAGQSVAYREFTVEELLDALPPKLSFSTLEVPIPNLAGNEVIELARRDLYDARFQLISEPSSGDDSEEAAALDIIDAPSDLMSGVYEGGLRLWECSLDLVEVLHTRGWGENAQGRNVLEIGCGIAIPSIYLIKQLFSRPIKDVSVLEETTIVLQDFNAAVLKLMTFPNVIIAWYISKSSIEYRNSFTGRSEQDDGSQESGEETAEVELLTEIHITPALKSAFLASLSTHKLQLRFISGSWDTFPTPEQAYDLVFTSETIYQQSSLPSLLDLLQATCSKSTECLVAAKVLYFGVGGGISDFIDTTKKRGGDVKTVWENKEQGGVGRRTLSVSWGKVNVVQALESLDI